MLLKKFVLIITMIVIPGLTMAQSGKVSNNLSLPSKILNGERKYGIYLPPDYATSERDYPALYLLNVSGDDQTRWIQFVPNP